MLFYGEKGMGNNGETCSGVPVKTGTILVVDDEPAIRNIASSVLSMHGYSVIEATDGCHALSICSSLNRQIDLLIVDIMMPCLDGFELVEQVNRMRSDVRVIYISGHVDPQEHHQQLSRLTEGKDFLKKPFRLSHLLEMVDNALGRRHR